MGAPRGFLRPPVLPRGHRGLAGRLGTALAVSLVVHGSLLAAVVSRWVGGWRPTPPVAFVELAEPRPVVTPDPVLLAQAAPDGDPEAAARESVAVAARLIEQGQRVGQEVEHRREIAALENRNLALERQLTDLVADRDMLAGDVVAARERAARLEQALAAQRAAETAALTEMREAYDRLVAALQREIAEKDVALEQANERLTVAIVDRVLFPSGQATLTAEGERVIDKVGTALVAVPGRRVLIEGHTDDVPIGPELRGRFPSNWELSTARATEVVKRLIAHGHLPPGRLSAVGRADTEPADSNTTEDGRRRNRRIEIILLPPAPPGGAS